MSTPINNISTGRLETDVISYHVCAAYNMIMKHTSYAENLMKTLVLVFLSSVFSTAHAQTDFTKCNQVLDQIEIQLNPTLGEWAARPSISANSELNVFRQIHERLAKGEDEFAGKASNESMRKDLNDAGGLDPRSRAYAQAEKKAKAAEAKVREDWKDPEKREAMIQKAIRSENFGGAGQDVEGSLKLGGVLHFTPDGKPDFDHFRKGIDSHPTLRSGNSSFGMPMSARLQDKDYNKKMEYILRAETDYKDGKLSVRFERISKNAWGPDLVIEMLNKNGKCVLNKIQSETRMDAHSHKDNNDSIGIRRTFFSQENCGKAQTVLAAKEFHKQPANLILSQSHMEVFYCPGSNNPLRYCKDANEVSPYANITPDPKPELEKYYAKFCKPFEVAIEKAPAPAAESRGWFNLFGSGAK